MIRAPRICGVMAGLMLLAGCSTPVDSEVAEGETTNASATDEALTQIEPSPEVQDLLPKRERSENPVRLQSLALRAPRQPHIQMRTGNPQA